MKGHEGGEREHLKRLEHLSYEKGLREMGLLILAQRRLGWGEGGSYQCIKNLREG